MSEDSITFAKPAGGKTTLAKIIRVEGGRIVGKDPSPQVKMLEYSGLPVHNLGRLYVAVKCMAKREAIAVRGKPNGPIGNRRIHHGRRHHPARDPELGTHALRVLDHPNGSLTLEHPNADPNADPNNGGVLRKKHPNADPNAGACSGVRSGVCLRHPNAERTRTLGDSAAT
jgi:hypothetical protein